MKNKTVIVTGASSGIGEATALAFARYGANVVLVARSADKLEAVKKQCEAFGAEALVVRCDVSIESDCRNMVEQAMARFARIDVLINNAGISMRALFADCDVDVIRRVMDVNFWGTVYCTKYALPHLLVNKGSVVAVSSLAGISGLPGRTGYAASKFAIGGFMQSLRIENLKKDLHVGVIYPGYTATNIRYAALLRNGEQQRCSPLNEKGLVSAEQVARNVVDMVVTRRRINILTIQGKLLKWLNGVWPSLVDRTIYKVVSKEKDSPFH